MTHTKTSQDMESLVPRCEVPMTYKVTCEDARARSVLPLMAASNGYFLMIPKDQMAQVGIPIDFGDMFKNITVEWEDGMTGWGHVVHSARYIDEIESLFMEFYPNIVHYLKRAINDHQE